MDLHTFLKTTGKRRELAARVGVSPNYLWQLAVRYRDRQPSPALAKRIHDETLGVVSLHSLRPDVWGVEFDNHNGKAREVERADEEGNSNSG